MSAPDPADVAAVASRPFRVGEGRCSHARCQDRATWNVQLDGVRHLLCDPHSRPGFHPADLRKQLPTAAERAVSKLRSQ